MTAVRVIWHRLAIPTLLLLILILSRPLIYLTPSRTMRCHDCKSYCCLRRLVPSHDTYLRDRCRVTMIRTCNALWAGNYYPVVHHCGGLMDPFCGAPGSSSSCDPSDPTTGTARSPPRNTSYSLTHAALLYCAMAERALAAQLSRAAYSPPYSPGPPTKPTLHAVWALSGLVRSLRRNCPDF